MTAVVLVLLGLVLVQPSGALRFEGSQNASIPRLILPEGPLYVGQEVKVVVDFPGAGVDDRLVAPERGIDGLQPSTTQINRSRDGWEFRFRLSRAGEIKIPGMVVESGSRSRRTTPGVLRVRPLPIHDQPSDFLGGVGRLQLASEVEPQSIQLGERIRVVLRLRGSGAWGSSRLPALDDWKAHGLRVEDAVTTLRDELTREVLLTCRPERVGLLAVPSVAISSFDPDMGRYITRRSPRIEIEISEAARIPVLVPSAQAPGSSLPFPGELLWALLILGLLLITAVSAAIWILQLRRQRARSPRIVAERLVDNWTKRVSPGDDAKRVIEGWTRFLSLLAPAPQAVVTPLEAYDTLMRTIDSPDLATRVQALLASCDRTLYSAETTGVTASGDRNTTLFGESIALLREVVGELDSQEPASKARPPVQFPTLFET
jgi:hypothetical protein